MAYRYSSGNQTVDSLGMIQISGSVVPQEWYKHILRENGKPHLLAIILLSDIVYWYRPTEVRDERTGEVLRWEKRFAEDYLQKSYQQYSNQYGESKRSIKAALDCLEELQLIRKIFRDIEFENSPNLYNVMYIDLNVQKLLDITYPDDSETGGAPDRPGQFRPAKRVGTVISEKVGGDMNFAEKYESGNVEPVLYKEDIEQIDERKAPEETSMEAIPSFENDPTNACSALQNNVEDPTEFRTTLLQNNVGGPAKFCTIPLQNNVGGPTKFCTTPLQNNVGGPTEFCTTLLQNNVGGPAKLCTTVLQNNAGGPTKDCKTNTKTTTETTAKNTTEITTETTTRTITEDMIENLSIYSAMDQAYDLMYTSPPHSLEESIRDEHRKRVQKDLEIIRQNTRYDLNMDFWNKGGAKYDARRKRFQALYDLICEVISVRTDYVRISGKEYSWEQLEERFLKLTDEHLHYVMECMDRQTGQIRNIKNYLLMSLYNAPVTIEDYETQAAKLWFIPGV